MVKCYDFDLILILISVVLRFFNVKDVSKFVIDFIIVMLDNLLFREEDEEMESIIIVILVKVNKMMYISGKNYLLFL